MFSRFTTVIFPRSKHLLNSWLQSPSEVILEPNKIKELSINEHHSTWRRLPLALPESHQADGPQVAEQLYQRNSRAVKKVLGSTTDFPTWGSSKRTKNTQRIWLGRPAEFDYRISPGRGKQTLGGHKQNRVCTRSQEKGAVSPQETEPDLPVSV